MQQASPESPAIIGQTAQHIRNIVKDRDWQAIYDLFHVTYQPQEEDCSVFLASVKKFCGEDIQLFLDLLPTDGAVYPTANEYPDEVVQIAFYDLVHWLSRATLRFKLLQSHQMMSNLLYVILRLLLGSVPSRIDTFDSTAQDLPTETTMNSILEPLHIAIQSATRHFDAFDCATKSSAQFSELQRLLDHIESCVNESFHDSTFLACHLYVAVLRSYLGCFRQGNLPPEVVKRVFAQTSRLPTAKERILYISKQPLMENLANYAVNEYVCVVCARHHERTPNPNCIESMFNKDSVYKSFRVCSYCVSVMYCSVECQRLDWKAGHRKACHRLAKGRRETSALSS